MDEIKSVIWQLPPQDIAILKTLYSPEMAKQDLSSNAQRMIAILDWLSVEEQQDAVNVKISELPTQEWWDVNVEVSETNVEPANPWDGEPGLEEPMTPSEEETLQNNIWNFEDYLI